MSIGDKQLKYVEPTQYIPATSMSKREFLAGLAMQALIPMMESSNEERAIVCHYCSVRAVQYADALIAELEKSK